MAPAREHVLAESTSGVGDVAPEGDDGRRRRAPLAAAVAGGLLGLGALVALLVVGGEDRALDATPPPGPAPSAGVAIGEGGLEPAPPPSLAPPAAVAIGVEPPVEPAATSLELWVSELACAGGASPAGQRLVGPTVVETDDTITIWAHVAPPTPPEDGTYLTCGGAPPVRVTLSLDEPVGERTLLDGTSEPPSPLEVRRFGM